MSSEGFENSQSAQDQPLSPVSTHIGTGDVGIHALVPTVIFTILATITIALRWYTRCKIVRRVGLDDYVILVSLLLSWIMCILICLSVQEGVGNYNTHSRTARIAKLIIAIHTLWAVTVNITKASILTQYLRVFRTPQICKTCYVLLASLIPATCWSTIGGLLLCTPVSKLWNPSIPGTCRNAQTYWISVASLDITLDFLILCLPLPSIASLNLPRKQKIATMLAFLFGFEVCIISVVRLATVLISARLGDAVMSGVWSIIWSAVEANVGIMCASLLAIKALVVRVWPKLLEEGDDQLRVDNVGDKGRNMEILKISTVTVQTEWRRTDEESATVLGTVGGSFDGNENETGLGIRIREPAACLAPSSTWNLGGTGVNSRRDTMVGFGEVGREEEKWDDVNV